MVCKTDCLRDERVLADLPGAVDECVECGLTFQNAVRHRGDLPCEGCRIVDGVLAFLCERVVFVVEACLPD